MTRRPWWKRSALLTALALIGVALAIYVVWYARVKKIPVTAPTERRGVRAAAKDAIA